MDLLLGLTIGLALGGETAFALTKYLFKTPAVVLVLVLLVGCIASLVFLGGSFWRDFNLMLFGGFWASLFAVAFVRLRTNPVINFITAVSVPFVVMSPCIAFILLYYGWCPISGLTCQPSTPSQASYAKGLDAYTAGDYEQAISDFTQAIELDPALAEVYYARGDVYYLLGNYDQAIADYSRALEEGYQPVAQAYSARGDAYRAMGNYTQGSADYDEAYTHNDTYWDAYYPERVKAYSRAIELNPNLASAYYARGWANYFLDNGKQAVADFSTAIELQHEPFSQAYSARGAANYSIGVSEQAIADFTLAIEFDPASANAYEGRGRAYIQQGSYEVGIVDLETAVEIDPNFARAHNNLCWFGSLLGHVEEVMASCERAVELAPDAPNIRDSRGLARALVGDYAGAIEDFRFYLETWKARGVEDSTRAFWLAELEAGRNPFDEATLKELLQQ